MKELLVHNKLFRELVPEEKIIARVNEMAGQINRDVRGKDVVFLGILNGAFMFAADLFRRIDFNSRISFVKFASYEGTSTSGKIKELIGWNEDLNGKTVVVIEDIVDTGQTLERITAELKMRKAAEIKIAAMFFKPDAYEKKIPLDYIGIEIPDNFVIGYGLDYNGYGRNLPSVYTLIG